MADRRAAWNCGRLLERRPLGVSESRLSGLIALRDSWVSTSLALSSAVLTRRIVNIETTSKDHGAVGIAEEFSSMLVDLGFTNGFREHGHGEEDLCQRGGRCERITQACRAAQHLSNSVYFCDSTQISQATLHLVF